VSKSGLTSGDNNDPAIVPFQEKRKQHRFVREAGTVMRPDRRQIRRIRRQNFPHSVDRLRIGSGRNRVAALHLSHPGVEGFDHCSLRDQLRVIVSRLLIRPGEAFCQQR
jgi:hypothetical protein